MRAHTSLHARTYVVACAHIRLQRTQQRRLPHTAGAGEIKGKRAQERYKVYGKGRGKSLMGPVSDVRVEGAHEGGVAEGDQKVSLEALR
eukprot:590164-Rhodomonas_salina.1